MKLSELQKKDIVNIEDGKIVGKIIDVEFDVSSGYMKHFVIERTNFVRSIFSSVDEMCISYNQIKKMGEDVILIEKE